jgi:hypothetical protein
LRLWQEGGGSPSGEALGGMPPGSPPEWPASLQNPQSEERRGFLSLTDLYAFRELETGG